MHEYDGISSNILCVLSIAYRNVISRGLSTILQILHCSFYRCNLCTILGHLVLRYRLPQILHWYTFDRYIRMNIQLGCTTVLFLIIFSKSFSYLWSWLNLGSECQNQCLIQMKRLQAIPLVKHPPPFFCWSPTHTLVHNQRKMGECIKQCE